MCSPFVNLIAPSLATQVVGDDEESSITGESQAQIPDVEFIGMLSCDPGFDMNYGLVQPEETVIVRAYSDDSDDMMLMELRPRFVVTFDPNLEFLRRMEVSHRALALRIRPENPLGVSKFKSRAAPTDVLPDVRGMQRRTQILVGIAKGEECVHTTDRGACGTLISD